MSTRNNILEAFKDLLAGITISGGYNYTVAKCVRKSLSWDNENRFPVVMVLGGAENFEDTLGGEVDSELSIVIRTFINDPKEPEETICKVLEDILKRLDDSVNNTYHSKMVIDGVDIYENMFNDREHEGFGVFDVRMIVVYSFARGAP